jgi:urease accessory protein
MRYLKAGDHFLLRDWATHPPSDVRGNDWLLWQLIDSAYPAGGFAHSGGIEAACNYGVIRSAADVVGFSRQVVRQACHGSVPFLSAAHSGIEVDDLKNLDDLLDSMLTNHVANRASRLQGQALLSTCQRVFERPELAEFQAAVVAGQAPGHLALVFGLVMRVLGIPRKQAVRMFLYVTLRGVISAAVRLGRIGPIHAQQVQAGMGLELEELAAEAEGISVCDAAQIAPLLELWQGGQDRLYSRLFQT